MEDKFFDEIPGREEPVEKDEIKDGSKEDENDPIPNPLPVPVLVDAFEKLRKIHSQAGERLETFAQFIDGFAVWEHFASSSLVLLSALLTWICTYFNLGMGFWCLGLWYLSFLYTKTIQRLRYKTRNQALKEHLLGVLDSDKEYVEWFNQFLGRFWMNFEPELSKGLKDSIGAALDTIKAPGVDEIVLSKFTLGSQAPRIDSIKTFTNTGDEVLILDFDISFTPFDTDAVSKKERLRKELRNLEIVLLAKVAMVPLPVSLKELYINGSLRIQFTFMSAYPHVKTLDLGFVTKPEIDFVLKPLGTDLSKIAGLGTFIKDTVDAQLALALVNPVKMTLPIGEWMGGSTGNTEIPVGVLRVVVYEAKGLKNVDVTGISDPAAILYIGGNEVARTRVFDNSLDPKWSEVHHVVIYQSMVVPGVAKADEFMVEVVHVNALSNSSLGTTSTLSLSKWIGLMGPLTDTDSEQDDLIHEWGSPFESNGNIWKNIHFEKKRHGSIRFDLSYFPIMKIDSLSASDQDTIVAGVVTVSIHQAKEVNMGHVCCVGKIDGVEMFRTPVRKRTANPSWNSSHTFYCADIAKSNVLFSIQNKNNEVGYCDLNIQKASKSTDDWYKVAGGPGKVRITVKFQSLDILHSTIAPENFRKVDPIGVFRIKVTEARDLYVSNADKATLGLAKNDPYCKVFLHGRTVGVTSTQEKNNLPKWHDTFYTLSYSMKEILILDVYDSQNLAKDRPIGKAQLQLSVLFDLAEGKKIAYLPPELEAVKVVKKGQFLDIWAPLLVREDAKRIETSKGSAEDISRMASNTAAVFGIGSARNSHTLITDSAADLLDPKLKPKGQIRIIIEFYPTVESAILDFSPSVDLGRVKKTGEHSSSGDGKNIRITETEPSPEKSEPKQEKKETTIVAQGGKREAREILGSYKSGILRFRANHALVHEKRSKIYLEIYLGESLFHSTFSSTLSSSQVGYWYSSSDHFVLDMSSVKLSLFLKEQIDSKRSSKDPVIGFWVGDFISSYLAKGPLNVQLRKHSQNWTNFDSLMHTATVEMSDSFYPAVLRNTTIEGNTGKLHLDVLNAKNLQAVDSNGNCIVNLVPDNILLPSSLGLSDPYVSVNLNGKCCLKTKILKKNLNPVFDEGVQIDVHSRIKSTVFMEIKDYNQFTSDVTLGSVAFSLSSIKPDSVTTLELSLDGSPGTLTIRYLFEIAVLEHRKDDNEKKLNTEASALGKLGKGLSHQVSGLGSMFGSALTAPLKEKKVRKTLTEEKSASLTEISDRDPAQSTATDSKESILKVGMPSSVQSLHNRGVSASSQSLAAPTEVGSVEVHIVEARDLKPVDVGGTSDPFVRVTFQGFQSDNKKIYKTAVIKKTLNPVWDNEKFFVPPNGLAIKLSIMDKNLLSYDKSMGHIILDIPTMMASKDSVDEFFRVQSGSGTLRVKIRKIDPLSSSASLDTSDGNRKRATSSTSIFKHKS